MLSLLALTGATADALPLRTVLVTVTKGFRHASIAAAERTLLEMANTSGSMTITVARDDDDLHLLSREALANIDLVIFANTSGELPLPDRQAFVDWVRDGGSFIGMHSASDTLHGFTPYLDMLGGEFDFHGAVVNAPVFVEDASHPSTASLMPVVSVRDEYYRFKRFNPAAVQVLLALHADPDSGKAGFFPISWARAYGRGKVFYTALGHETAVWDAEWFRQHLAGAVASMTGVVEHPRRRRAVRP